MPSALRILRWGIVSLMTILVTTAGSVHASGTEFSTTASPSTQNQTRISGVVTWGNGTGVSNVSVVAVPQESNAYRLFQGQYVHGATNLPELELHAELAASPHPPGVVVTRTNTTGNFSLTVPTDGYTISAVSRSKDYISEVKNTTANQNESITLQQAGGLNVDCFGCSRLGVDTVRTPPNTTISINVTTTAVHVSNSTLNLTFDERVFRVERVTTPDEFRITNQTINNEAGWVRVNQSLAADRHVTTLLTLHARIVVDRDSESFVLFDDSTTVNSLAPTAGITTQGHVIVNTTLERPQTTCAPSGSGMDINTIQFFISAWARGEFSLKKIQRIIDRWLTQHPQCQST